MGAYRFDALLRGLAASPTRRGVGRTLAGLTLGGMLGQSGLNEVEARKRKRKKKKCRGGTKKCGKKCFDLQTDPLHCGSCGNRCDDGKECRDGNCSCPQDETACDSACCGSGLSCVDDLCVELCTENDDCLIGQACDDGACTCPEAACAAAIDPTDDQFEECFCAETVEGEQACFANISCAAPPPTCTSSSECAFGTACIKFGCGGDDRCTTLCPLS
jgi:hypothetical protein